MDLEAWQTCLSEHFSVNLLKKKKLIIIIIKLLFPLWVTSNPDMLFSVFIDCGNQMLILFVIMS